MQQMDYGQAPRSACRMRFSAIDKTERVKPDVSHKIFSWLFAIALYGMSIYIALHVLVIVMMPYIIELCVTKWKVELKSLDLGPPPIWLHDPPLDFRHLPLGSNKYANISLTLAVDNNPWWLEVKVSGVQITIRRGPELVRLYQSSEPFAGNAEFSVVSRVPLSQICAIAYFCLRHLPTGQSLILSVAVYASFAIHGLTSNNYIVQTNTLYNGTKVSGGRQHPVIRGSLNYCIEANDDKFKMELSDNGYQRVTIEETGSETEFLLIGNA